MAPSSLYLLGDSFCFGCVFYGGLPFCTTSLLLEFFSVMNTRTLLVRAVFVGAFGISLWIGTVSYRFFQRTGMIKSEIQELEHEVDRINRENATLREKIEYFSSASFQEREAKEKLGLKKIDEQVIIVRTPVDAESKISEYSIPIIGTGRVAEFRSPNYVKWWRLVFGNQRPM